MILAMSAYRAVFRCIAGCPGEYPVSEPIYRCPRCGDLLEVSHDIEALRVVLRTAAQALRPVARIHVPLAHGRLLAELHRDGEVLSQHQEDGVVIVHARVEARTLGRLRRDGITVELPG